AREQPTEAEVVEYFYAQDAAALIMTSESETEYSYLDEAAAIRSDPRFQQYELVKKLGNSAGFPYFQYIYLRKSSLPSITR
ncbi:MAG: hypothetical protein AAF570_19130, partial [Bacteroidota bacterium]